MLTTWIRKVTKSKEFFEGAKIVPENNHNLKFKNDLDKVGQMFELRNWYVRNSPHSFYSEKYTNEMAYLHNEINYLNSNIMLKRAMVCGGLILLYATYVVGEPARDWKDQFDLKFNQKIYGSAAGSSGEGATGIDD